MGNKESVDHHILLYGQQGHGKTNFLYDNFLNGKWDEEQQKVESSLGYNFEILKVIPDQKYGVWDISGNPQFVDLHDHFLKTIPFTGILYILQPAYFNGFLVEDKMKQIGIAREQIHYLANHCKRANKFMIIILNIDEEKLVPNGIFEVPPEKFTDIIEEMSELLKFSQIPLNHKDISIIERGNYIKLWERVAQLIAQIKK